MAVDRRRRRREPADPRPLLLLLVAVFALTMRFAQTGPLYDLRETISRAIARNADFSAAAETLGRVLGREEGEEDNAVLVFGRMILGLEPEEETPEELPEVGETADTFATDACGLTESSAPQVRLADFCSAAPEEEDRDETPNAPFHIPSPDVVDDARYAIAFPTCLPLESCRVTSRFGYRIHPISGNTTFHYGADLAAPAGTKVAAVADGTVTETGCGEINGNYVRVSHAGGFATMYGHLKTISVKKGQNVSMGDKLGAVGSTGYSTGPHLHFELRKDGKIIDPFSCFALG